MRITEEQYKKLKNSKLGKQGLPPMTANGLTKAIIQFLDVQGVTAWRNNIMGVFDIKRASSLVQKWVRSGFPKDFKSIKRGLATCYRKSHERKGVSDIVGHDRATGRAVYIEVKVGKDKISPDQEYFLEDSKRAHCITLIARTWEQFLNDWEALAKSKP